MTPSSVSALISKNGTSGSSTIPLNSSRALGLLEVGEAGDVRLVGGDRSGWETTRIHLHPIPPPFL
jgi:hypothetical protein